MNLIRRFFERPGLHESQLRRYFDEFEFSADTEPRQAPVCIMLFMNRSGSSMIGEYMRATGAFSGFGEPFNHDLVVQRAQEHDIASFPDYIRWLDRHIHREGTLFAMKASSDQVMMLQRSKTLEHYFQDVRWALVKRRDVLAQAISYYIAEQTQRWHSFQEGNLHEPAYDFKAIRERLNSIALSNDALDLLCKTLAIEPYTLYYEDFVGDPEGQTQRFAAYLGEEAVQINPKRLKMRKQGNETNRVFHARFLDDMHARGEDFSRFAVAGAG